MYIPSSLIIMFTHYDHTYILLAYTAAIATSAGSPIVSNQVQFSLLSRYPLTSGLTETCQELGVSCTTYFSPKVYKKGVCCCRCAFHFSSFLTFSFHSFHLPPSPPPLPSLPSPLQSPLNLSLDPTDRL